MLNEGTTAVFEQPLRLTSAATITFPSKLSLRTEPELHARTAIKAQLVQSKSINQFVAEILRLVVMYER